MMMSALLPPDASLAEVLSARAMRTPASRLWIEMAGGALVLVVAAWARPTGWLVVSGIAGCALFYSLWAVAERRLRTMAWPFVAGVEARWRLVRGIAGALGIASFVVLLFAGLGVGLGRLIS